MALLKILSTNSCECRPVTVPTEGWDGFESRPVRKSPKEIWGFFVQKILGECRPDTVPTEGWDGFESRPVRKSPKEIWGFFVQKILGECRPDTVPTEGWDGFESRPVRKSPKEIWGFFVQKILGECRQLQYSVYLRYCGSSETADVHEKRLTNWVPPEGHVWVLRITDNTTTRY